MYLCFQAFNFKANQIDLIGMVAAFGDSLQNALGLTRRSRREDKVKARWRIFWQPTKRYIRLAIGVAKHVNAVNNQSELGFLRHLRPRQKDLNINIIIILFSVSKIKVIF